MFFPSATRVPFLDFDGKPRAFSRILKTASLCVLSVSGAAALRGGSDENSGGLFERVTRQRARVGARKRGGGCCGAPVSRASGAGGSSVPFLMYNDEPRGCSSRRQGAALSASKEGVSVSGTSRPPACVEGGLRAFVALCARKNKLPAFNQICPCSCQVPRSAARGHS